MSKVKDEYIDKLLCFMKDEIESLGATPETCDFDFNRGGKAFLAFQKQSQLSEEDIDATLKACRSRKYIKHSCLRPNAPYMLTTAGHGRAISYERAKDYPKEQQPQNVVIGNINGPTQIGNHNIQNIEGTFIYLIDQINNSNAPEEQKMEVKDLLRKVLEHPITNTIIGSGISVILSSLGG